MLLPIAVLSLLTSAATSGDEQGYELADEFIERHSGDSTLEKFAGAGVVCGDAREIEGGRRIGLKLPKQLVTPAQHIETPGITGVEAQTTQVTDTPRLYADKSLAY